MICRTSCNKQTRTAAKLRALLLRQVFGSRLAGLAALVLLISFTPPATPQAVQQQSQELPCKVQLFGPELDFELRFFTGFRLSAPTAPLAGPDRLFALRVLVTPLDGSDIRPALFERNFRSGPIPPGKSEFQLRDSFATGVGKYMVRWVLVDSNGPSCVVEKQIEAKLRGSELGMALTAQPGEVVDSRLRLFRPERVIVGESDKPPLRVKVFLNLDVPRTRSRTSIRMWEIMPRISALRALSRHPRIGGLSMVAYSVEEQLLVARHGLQNSFDYRALRRRIDDLEPGFVSIDQLQRDSDLAFFNEMLLKELPGDEEVDAYIFLGPDVLVRKNREKDLLGSIGPLQKPVFFLADGRSPWKGLIGKTVSFFNGKTLRYYNPSQMAEGVQKLVEQLDGTAE